MKIYYENKLKIFSSLGVVHLSDLCKKCEQFSDVEIDIEECHMTKKS